MDDRVYNVLFLCTGNTARSILAEAILNKDGGRRFRAFSAGSYPKGHVNPLSLKVLGALDYPTEGLRSKSWDEFAVVGAPEMDFIFTVCDDAAGEVCPVWPGQPLTAHWGIEDPAKVAGTEIEKERAFSLAAKYMKNRITAFLSLPLEAIDRLWLTTHLQAIGKREGLEAELVAPTDANLRSALSSAGLPTDDLGQSKGHFFHFSDTKDATVGYGGVEITEETALLRSVVVLPAHKGQGSGAAITRSLLRYAEARGANAAYLLTTDCEPFFSKLGFQKVARTKVPASIIGSTQVSGLCPSTALVMMRSTTV